MQFLAKHLKNVGLDKIIEVHLDKFRQNYKNSFFFPPKKNNNLQTSLDKIKVIKISFFFFQKRIIISTYEQVWTRLLNAIRSNKYLLCMVEL